MLSYLSLGANLGNAKETLGKAIVAIGATNGIKVVKQSSFYRTAPVEATGPDFINVAIEIETTLEARELLRSLQRIEKAFGRVRPAGVFHAPRTLDIDVLTYGNTVSNDPFLLLPHPRMSQRAFVLVPLAEIAPNFSHPTLPDLKTMLQGVLDQRIDRLTLNG